MSDPDYPEYNPERYADACPECGEARPYMTPVSDVRSPNSLTDFLTYDREAEHWALLATIECADADCDYRDVINLRPRP